MASKVFALVLLLGAAYPERTQAQSTSHHTSEIRLNGAGSTIANVALHEWIAEYQRTHTGIRIGYQAIGSGGGIRALMALQTMFGVTEGPMTDEQLAKAGGHILHFPVILRAVVPAYNLPQVPELHLSGSTLADIFLGKITKWNDPAIASDNLGVDLPKMDIKAVHHFPRRDGSATTFLASEYLSKISPVFKEALDQSDGKSWPVPTGLEGRGGGGWDVAAAVYTFPGSIGFMDRIWADQNHLHYAAVKNAEGEFVMASLESITAAAAAGVSVMQTKAQDFRLFITNEPGKATYPVSSFIWMILYDDDKDKEQHEALVDFLKWILTDGQKLAPRIGYPPLPPELVELELKAIH